jgi:hypothetical protein
MIGPIQVFGYFTVKSHSTPGILRIYQMGVNGPVKNAIGFYETVMGFQNIFTWGSSY